MKSYFNRYNGLLRRFLAIVLVITMAVPMWPQTMVFARELIASNNRFSVYGNDPAVGVGEGVNAITGSFARSYTDIELAGTPGLRLVRTYNSLNTATGGDMGTGWRHNFMFSLETIGNTIVITMNDGVNIAFTNDGNGNFTPQGNVDFTLSGSSSAGFALVSPTGLTYNFAPNGTLSTIVDRQGITTTLTHTNGRLSRVSNNSGYLSFSYSGGMLAGVTDNLGRSVSFAYNYDGQMSSFTDTAGRTSRYFYTNELLTEVRDFTGNVILTNEFDSQGRITRQVGRGGASITIIYDDASMTNHVTDNRGRTVSFTYNEMGKLAALTEPCGTTTFEYDDRGWLVSRTDTVSVGWAHSTVILDDGSLWAWGLNESRQFSGREHIEYRQPIKIMDDVIMASAGHLHTSAINSAGELWTWGRRLGFDFDFPTLVADNVVYVSSGRSYTAFIKDNGELWAWGANLFGQIGVGQHHLPLWPEKLMDGVSSVSAGRYHTLIITNDDVLWALGSNMFGQLGDGSTSNQNSPIKIMEDVVFVSAGGGSFNGGGHSMAITSDGSLWAWGENARGQLGDGTTEHRHEPVKIMNDVVYVATGISHTMAITACGTLWGWGSNFDGQLGNGTEINSYTPIEIMQNVVDVSAGMGHTMAITENGELWAWGFNSNGQLGDGTTTSRLSPIRIN